MLIAKCDSIWAQIMHLGLPSAGSPKTSRLWKAALEKLLQNQNSLWANMER